MRLTKKAGRNWPVILLTLCAVIAVVFILLSMARVTQPERQQFSKSSTSFAKATKTNQSLETPSRSAAENVQNTEVFREKFDLCGAVRITCVVDGDTIWLEGSKIRVADIDTPEVSDPKCASELELGQRATRRFLALLNEGPFEVHAIGGRDEDRYGRKLRVISRDGRSLGDELVAEGLARTWSGRREPWC